MARKVTLRKVWRWSSRIVLGSVALVILLVAIVIGAVHTKFGREKIRRELESQLQEDFPGSTVGPIDGSPFGTLTVTGITIAGKDGRPFVTVESAELGVQIKPLLGKTVHVDTVTLHGVLVDLAAQPDPKSQKPDPMKPAPQPGSGKPSAWDIEVPSIVVRDARVLTKEGERLDGIDLDAGIRMHGGTLDATAAIKAEFRKHPFSAAASVTYANAIDVRYADVRLGDASITVLGAHVVLDPHAVAANAAASVVKLKDTKHSADTDEKVPEDPNASGTSGTGTSATGTGATGTGASGAGAAGTIAVDGTIIAHLPAALINELNPPKPGAKPLPGDISLVIRSNGGNVAFDISVSPTDLTGTQFASLTADPRTADAGTGSAAADSRTANAGTGSAAADPRTADAGTGSAAADSRTANAGTSAPRTNIANAVVASATARTASELHTHVRGFAHLDLSKLDLSKLDDLDAMTHVGAATSAKPDSDAMTHVGAATSAKPDADAMTHVGAATSATPDADAKLDAETAAKTAAMLDALDIAGDVLVTVEDPRGRVNVALTGSTSSVRGIVSAEGRFVVPMTDGSVLDATGGALVAIDVQRSGASWNLVSGLVGGEAATRLDQPVQIKKRIIHKTSSGKAAAGVALHGTLAPVLALDAAGTVEATDVRSDETRVQKAVVHFDAKDATGNPVVASRVEVEGLQQGTFKIPTAEISTKTSLHEDGSIDVDLLEHRIVTADGREWTGHGGHVAVTEQTIDVKDLQTGTGSSRATASVKLGRLTDDMSGKAKVTNVSLAMLDPKLRGVVGGELTFAQKHGSYSGKGSFDGKGIVVPGKPALDGHVGLELAGRRVRVEASGTTAAGGGHVAFEVQGPRDIKDPVAWKGLERSALTELTIGIDHLDASKLGLTDPKDPTAMPVTGVVDGELTIGAADAKGSLRVSGITTKAGAVETTLSLAPGSGGTIDAHVVAGLAGVKPATVDANVALPQHPFDPDEWARLGNGALKHATIRAEKIAFDRALLARLGVERDISGVIDATVNVEGGLSAAALTFDVENVTGPELRAPVAMHVEAGIGGKGTTATMTANMGSVGISVDAKSPLTMVDAIGGKGPTAGLDVTLTIPTTKATQILALLGRQDLVDGQVAGTVKVTGSVDKPNVVANLIASNLTPPPTIATKKPPKLEQLTVAARWTGKHAELEVTGFESGGKLLKISGRGDIDKPSSVAATIEAAGFDIAPLVAFAPGALGAARGQLDGVIKVNGLDPQTGDVRGKLHLTEGRLPLAPTLGTVRKADVEITIAKQDMKAVISAKLGAGTITGTAGAKLTGGVPREADFDLALRKISPIGAVQPVIDMDTFGKFTFADGKVSGKINMRKGKVYVPPDVGDELIDTGAPADMFFVGPDGAVIPKPTRKQAEKPWLFVDVDVGRTALYVDDPMVVFEGTASGQLHLEVGQGVTLTGSLSTEKGSADVLGRRYQIDHAIVDFEGTYDPRLDIRLIHDFKTMSLTVDVVGTSLVPDLRFKGDPGSYTQGQLFAFFMGAEPSDDSTGQGTQAVTGAASALLSSRLGRKVNKYLPFKLDTLNYEAGTATSSGAVRAGIRLSDRSHLIWRQRFEPRPDENPGEAVFEYIIRPWALVEATGGERAGGGDIMLRKRW